MGETTELYAKEFERFNRLLTDKKELLIVIHNNPDPDAIASAFALSYLTQKISAVKPSIAYGGTIGRIENKVMVSRLHIQLKQIKRIKYDKYDLIALIDTQPGAGNNDFPLTKKCHIVLDHHPRRKDTKADLIIIIPALGATATILVSWFRLLNQPMPADIATAITYALSSETQNLSREVNPADLNAYLYVYPKSSLKKLSVITTPSLPNYYFNIFARSLKNTCVYRNLAFSNLGEIPSAEFVAEIADFIIRHRNISWCLCTGYHKNLLYLSLRTTRHNAQAGKIIKKIVGDVNNVGGHDMTAGGFIILKDTQKSSVEALVQKLSVSLAVKLGYAEEKIKWKPLVEEEIIPHNIAG
ncbi:MAG: DHH family phosphoesterase [Spirochaetales bacterium]|nr:DHH family phosphoesterase [Spirochaetales bacterium]